MPRRGRHPPRRGSPESPSPRRLFWTASLALALADHVPGKVGLAARHTAPPTNLPDHTGRPETVVKHPLAPLAPVPRPSLGFLKVVPETLRFVEPSFGTGRLGLLDLRSLRSLWGRCARLGGGLALWGAGSTGRTLCRACLALRGLLCRTLRASLNLVAVVGLPCSEPSGSVGQCGHRRQTSLPVARRTSQDPSVSHRRRRAASPGVILPVVKGMRK